MIDERTFQALMARLNYLENRYSRTEVIETGREVLTASRTYYVRTDGSNSNTGLANTAGGAFLTIQKAIDVATGSLDISIYTVTIQVGAGTYTGAVRLKPFVGSGTIIMQGDLTTPSNVVISTTSADAVYGSEQSGLWILKGFKLQTTTSGNGITLLAGNVLYIDRIDFGVVAGAHHLYVSNGARVFANGATYNISGASAYSHMFAAIGGGIQIYGATMTLLANAVFGIFAGCDMLGIIDSGSVTYTLGAFTVTGQRYLVTLNSVIQTNGGGAGYFPGTVAGATATGGQYA